MYPRVDLNWWLDFTASESTALWAELVPSTGSAETVQGELVRAMGRIEQEYNRNGMMNWGDGYYEALLKFVHSTLKSDATFSRFAQKVIDADVARIEASGTLGKAIAKGKRPLSAAYGGNILASTDTTVSQMRLNAAIVVWCKRHPELVPYSSGKPA